MIFRQWQQVLDGTKTQTRRIVKPGEFAAGARGGSHQEIFSVWVDKHDLQDRSGQFGFVRTPLQILEALYRLKWHRAFGCFWDKTYAVQPGRGKKAVGRIRITRIRRERLQDIRIRDIYAEGIEPAPFVTKEATIMMERYAFTALWNSINKKSGTRWADNPEVWVLEFKVINENTL